MKKFISVITAAAAVAAISATAGAYSINKDLGFGWSNSVTIGAEEFADVTPDTTVTITYNVNESLASMEGQDYWCIKPMVNDAGWPFISTLNGAVLSEGGDSYTLEMDSNSMSFTIPADQLELLQNAGMALGLEQEAAGTWCSILLVLLSVLLTGFNLYPSIAKWGGAGALVPITGFANGVASAAIEYKKEGQVFGIGSKIFTIAGPVILYGVVTSWILGLIFWLFL